VSSRTWAFNFNIGYRKIRSFSWYDYRGSVLSEREQDNPTDVGEFQAKLKESGCLVLCVAGDELATWVDGGSAPRGVRRFNWHLQKFYQERKTTVPIVIALTKGDRCPDDKIERGVDMLRNSLLSSLFTRGTGWLVMLCPVSLGMTLPGGPKPMAKGHIRPINVHLPVTFAIFFQIMAERQAAEQKLTELESRRSDTREHIERMRAGLWSSIVNRSEIRAARSHIGSLEEESQMTEQEARELSATLARMRKGLLGKHIYIYYDGNRVSLDEHTS
jgi:hypothetical protein